MSPGERYIKIASRAQSLDQHAQILYIRLYILLSLIMLAISLAGCSNSSVDGRQAESAGRSLLSNLRPKADPAMVERIAAQEKEEAARQAQATIYTETAGPEQVQAGLGRALPKVSSEPFSNSLIAPPADSVSATGTILTANEKSNTNSYHSSAQLATYETAYNAVPPPPPGALGAGLVPPPPAVSLSTQAQAMADSAAAFYNNPYFNPFAVPAPPQASMPSRRPAGLFGEGGSRNEYDDGQTNQKHKADFVPITPKGMESRSPYKQRDDLRALWKAAIKSPAYLGELSGNPRMTEQLSHIEVGLPAESTKGSFNVSSRQIESIFKASSIDSRILPLVRKVQTELVQSYYRYLSTYNKYALIEQTVAARKQEVDLAETASEKQRAAADLAQSQNEVDAAKDDLHSAEIELAAASSPASAKSVISRVAGTAPSVESLAQGVAQSGPRGVSVHTTRIAGFFDSILKRPYAETAEASTDLTENTDEKPAHTGPLANKKDNEKLAKAKESKTKESKGGIGLFGRFMSHSDNAENSANTDSSNNKETSKTKTASANDDLSPAPITKSNSDIETPHEHASKSASPTGNISFTLKNVSINPRKSVLTVAVKNSGPEAFELNPDAIYIAEGTRKLGAGALRADFDLTSIEPNQEVKGIITVLSRPWNDKLVIYLADGNKTIQLKR